jgi:hypothetical protein
MSDSEWDYRSFLLVQYDESMLEVHHAGTAATSMIAFYETPSSIKLPFDPTLAFYPTYSNCSPTI